MNINKQFKATNSLVFRRLILIMVLISILETLIPNIFDFEKYYGLRHFVDQGYIGLFLNEREEFLLTIFMSFFSLTSIILIYFFISIGRFVFLTNIIINFLIIIFDGDTINYGALYPLHWFKSIIEATLIFLMFFGNCKTAFEKK